MMVSTPIIKTQNDRQRERKTSWDKVETTLGKCWINLWSYLRLSNPQIFTSLPSIWGTACWPMDGLFYCTHICICTPWCEDMGSYGDVSLQFGSSSHRPGIEHRISMESGVCKLHQTHHTVGKTSKCTHKHTHTQSHAHRRLQLLVVLFWFICNCIIN